MNEVFETLSDVFEELRSESEDREYFVQTGSLHIFPSCRKRTGSFWKAIWMWWIMPITRRNSGHIIRDLWTAYRFLTDLAL